MLGSTAHRAYNRLPIIIVTTGAGGRGLRLQRILGAGDILTNGWCRMSGWWSRGGKLGRVGLGRSRLTLSAIELPAHWCPGVSLSEVFLSTRLWLTLSLSRHVLPVKSGIIDFHFRFTAHWSTGRGGGTGVRDGAKHPESIEIESASQGLVFLSDSDQGIKQGSVAKMQAIFIEQVIVGVIKNARTVKCRQDRKSAIMTGGSRGEREQFVGGNYVRIY